MTWAMAQPLSPATTTTTGTAETIPLDNTAGSSASAPASVPPATSPFVDEPTRMATRADHREIGDATRSLLQMQAEGSNADQALPILGDEASRSYKRYMDSFEHPIPEYFKKAVEKSGSSSQ